MFDILMYLIEIYVQNDMELSFDSAELTEELGRAGFKSKDIDQVVPWVEQLTLLQGNQASYRDSYLSRGQRIFSQIEYEKLGLDTCNYLMFLERVGIIDAISREIVIDKIILLDKFLFDSSEIKWIILMVLYNAGGYELAYQKMAILIDNEEFDCVWH